MKKCLIFVFSFLFLSSIFNSINSANAFEQPRITAAASSVTSFPVETGSLLIAQPVNSEAEEETEYRLYGNNSVSFNGTLAPERMVAHTQATARVPEYRIAGSGEEGEDVAEDSTEEAHAPAPRPAFEGREPAPGTPVGLGTNPTVNREGIVPAATGRVLDRDGVDSAEITSLADAGDVAALDDQGVDGNSVLEVRGNSLIGGCSLQAPSSRANLFQTAAFLVVVSAPVVFRKKLFATR